MAVGKKSTHKNAARSRHLIKQAFAELLNEKDMSKITVTDIVERANISRGTFYAHYLDVYDLYAAIQSNIVEAIDETIDKVGMDNIILDPTEVIITSIQFLEKNKNYYKLFLTSSHGETLIKRIISLAEEKFAHEIEGLLPVEETTEYICHMYYTLGGFRNILIHWFMDPMGLTSDQCAMLLSKFYLANRSEKLCEVIREKKKDT
ncbi:MAG: TetR family transcriptional regulator [Ruminococcaceae bacterium]|nr:TetR family transcriptional regulator [Oscillospiraceae bacterium]MBR3597681.1 TetR/AcrR family transcriptional regulator C-terminal domain-containing protein [Clostridia bacterium]